MNEHYECKIASLAEMEKQWDYLIKSHTDDRGNWIVWRESALKKAKEGKAIPYYGFLNGAIICEATALIYPDVVTDNEGLVDEHTAHLQAFRTIKPLRGKGWFSKLMTFMLDDLRKRGYTRVTVGVEPTETKNKEIYAHFGFTEYIKSGTDIYPDGTVINVEYYGKTL